MEKIKNKNMGVAPVGVRGVVGYRPCESEEEKKNGGPAVRERVKNGGEEDKNQGGPTWEGRMGEKLGGK